MRANVQGLEEGDSDVDIEIVDFADGKNCSGSLKAGLHYGDYRSKHFEAQKYFLY